MTAKKKKSFLIIYILIAAIILAIALLAPLNNIIRLILSIVALIVISIRKFKLLDKKRKYTPLYTLIYLIALILLDSICVVTFSKTPIFALNIVNNNDIKVYNALGYKVWQCNTKKPNELIVEPFYKKGYKCSVEEIENISINDLITSLNNNYEEYRNTYVKVTGKISKKDGQNYIEMQAYTESEDNINGYVTFQEAITLAIIFDEYDQKLDVYDIYDEITVIGKIKNMETKEDKRIIYMYESTIASDIELDEYTITASSNKKIDGDKQLIYTAKDSNVYTYGIENIIVKFKDNLEYELPSVLSSKKLEINEIIKDANEIITDEKNQENKSKLYKFKTYNIVVCDQEKSKDIIITSPKLKLNDIKCTIAE